MKFLTSLARAQITPAVLLWVMIVASMLPIRNVSYGDDWAYAQSVRATMRESRTVISEWSMVPLVLQVWWGVLAARVFGFSFVTLQATTIVFFLAYLTGFYFLLKELGVPTKNRFYWVLLTTATGWFLLFSLSFMSDVPFTAIMVWAIAISLRGFRTHRRILLLAGSILASASMLVRQMGLAIPLGLVIGSIRHKKHKHSVGLNIGAICIVPFVTVLLYVWWLRGGNETITQRYSTSDLIINVHMRSLWPDSAARLATLKALLQLIFMRMVRYSSQLAVWLSLGLAASFPRWRRALPMSRKILVVLTVLVVVGADRWLPHVRKYSWSYLTGYPVELFEYSPARGFLEWAWPMAAVSGLGITGIFFVSRFRSHRFTREVGPLVSILLLILAMSIVGAWEWGEYIIPMIPLAVAVSAVAMSRINPTAVSFCLVGLVFLHSMFSVRQQYQTRGVAWERANQLVEEGVDPRRLSPANNPSWYPWWTFESLIDQRIQQTGGDKYRLGSPYELPVFENY